ncbi:unnamed protein product, partial [Brassica rapa]
INDSSLLEELGSPTQHISGAPFVLIPDENLEEAKEEFRDFLFARFHGEAPDMGRIIGIVNAIWCRSGPRIFVHRLGPLTFLLRITNPRNRALVLARTVWIIAGCTMFVAPWSPEFFPEEPQITSAVVPVELRGVPYLLFNKKSLSRLATAVGKPISLSPETERKENFEVAKLWVRVDLFSELPKRIVSGFSNGREVDISVAYPWLPSKCDYCGKFGHETKRCSLKPLGSARNAIPSRRSKSRDKRGKKQSRQGMSYIYVRKSPQTEDPIGNDAGNTVINSDDGNLVIAPVQEEAIDHVPDPIEGKVSGECPPEAEQETTDAAPHALEPDPDQCTPKGETPKVSRDTEVVKSSQVISLDRACCASSVTVMHTSENSDAGHQEDQNSSPFFLVYNRKSGRKVTRH